MSTQEMKMPGITFGKETKGITIEPFYILEYPTRSLKQLQKIQEHVSENKRIDFKNTLPKLVKNLFPPTVHATLTHEEKKDVLRVEGFVLLPKEYLSERNLFKYSYDLMLNHDSNYELTVYISVDKSYSSEPKKESNSFPELFYFSFGFNSEPFELFHQGNPQSIVLEKIRTVKLFIGDPKNILKLDKQFNYAITAVRDEMPIVIPGQRILSVENEAISVKDPIRVEYPLQHHFKGIDVMEKLLAPKIMAIRSENTLSISSICLLNESLKLIATDFQYHYGLELVDPSFDSESNRWRNKYKLVLYIAFSKKATIIKRPSILDVYCHQVDFKDEIEFKFSNGKEGTKCISVEDISNVGVCIVEIDPETSRGTETQVQQGGG